MLRHFTIVSPEGKVYREFALKRRQCLDALAAEFGNRPVRIVSTQEDGRTEDVTADYAKSTGYLQRYRTTLEGSDCLTRARRLTPDANRRITDTIGP